MAVHMPDLDFRKRDLLGLRKPIAVDADELILRCIVERITELLLGFASLSEGMCD